MRARGGHERGKEGLAEAVDVGGDEAGVGPWEEGDRGRGRRRWERETEEMDSDEATLDQIGFGDSFSAWPEKNFFVKIPSGL